jgi:hypothetical protein
MSAITSEWSSAEAAAAAEATNDSSKTARTCSREEEFRLALDRYIAVYVAQQRRRAEALEGRALPTEPNLARASGWRRFLAATREIWLIRRSWAETRGSLGSVTRIQARAKCQHLVRHEQSVGQLAFNWSRLVRGPVTPATKPA